MLSIELGNNKLKSTKGRDKRKDFKLVRQYEWNEERRKARVKYTRALLVIIKSAILNKRCQQMNFGKGGDPETKERQELGSRDKCLGGCKMYFGGFI